MNINLLMVGRYHMTVAAFWGTAWKLLLIAPTRAMVVKLRSFTLQKATSHLIRATMSSGRI